MYSGVSESKEEKSSLATVKTQNVTSKLQIRQNIKDLALKHNAVIDWKKSLGEKGSYGLYHTYTIEVEDALIRTDDRPILFFGSVNDIVRKDDSFIVYFSNWFNDLLGLYSSANIRLVLESTDLQVDEILKKPTDKFSFSNNFAIIAQITEVEKIRFQLTAGSSGNENIDIIVLRIYTKAIKLFSANKRSVA